MMEGLKDFRDSMKDMTAKERMEYRDKRLKAMGYSLENMKDSMRFVTAQVDPEYANGALVFGVVDASENKDLFWFKQTMEVSPASQMHSGTEHKLYGAVFTPIEIADVDEDLREEAVASAREAWEYVQKALAGRGKS